MVTAQAQSFLDALAALERDRDVEPMAALYADDAEIGNVTVPTTFSGPAGAREFWTAYRDTFGDRMESSFRNVIATEDRAVYEWTTTGDRSGGSASYDGVSVAEFADGKVTRFRAYFNPADLVERPTASS